MIELTYQLSCPEKAQNQARYIFALFASLTGIRLRPGSDNSDIIYGNVRASQSLNIPCQDIPANMNWRLVTIDGLSIPLPDSITEPFYENNTNRFAFDLISDMGAYLKMKLAAQNRQLKAESDITQAIKPEFYEYVKLLCKALIQCGKLPNDFQPKSPWPNQASFALGLSHDIDILKRKIPGSLLMVAYSLGFGDYKGGFPGALHGLGDSVSSQLFGRTNPYCHFERLFKDNLPSTLFVFAGKRVDSKDPTYKLDSLFRELKPYLDKNRELALHNGIGTSGLAEKLSEAKQSLVTQSNQQISGIRPHYLDCRFPDFWQNLSEFDYSSSVGSDSIPGFNAGINFPIFGFSSPDWQKLKILELPIGLMDCALFSIHDPERRRYLIDDLISACITNHGLLVIDWHNTSAYEPDFPGWFEAYEYLLDKAKQKGAFIGSLGEINNIWRSHCESVFLS
jgi:hypothetical protein